MHRIRIDIQTYTYFMNIGALESRNTLREFPQQKCEWYDLSCICVKNFRDTIMLMGFFTSEKVFHVYKYHYIYVAGKLIDVCYDARLHVFAPSMMYIIKHTNAYLICNLAHHVESQIPYLSYEGIMSLKELMNSSLIQGLRNGYNNTV